MKNTLRNPGFSLVGALTASTIGALSLLGLAQMSINIINTINRSKQEFNLITLSEEIKHTFQQPAPTSCSGTGDCFSSCTSSLIGYNAISGSDTPFTIKKAHSVANTVGPDAYEGNQEYKGIKIQKIEFSPSSGKVKVYFSPSTDTRETLAAPPSLEFTVLVDEQDSSNKITKCSIVSSSIAGVGLPGIDQNCRKVEAGPTLIGCGGTNENQASDATAFGYQASGKDSKGKGNSFFGYQAGLKSEIGKSNTFVGYQAGYTNEHGDGNTFVGYQAGENTTTGGNTFVGYQAGNKNTTNGGNTFVGYQAGVNTTTGEGNVFVGSLAGNNNTTGSNNILIGYETVHSTGNSHLNIGGLIKGRVWNNPAESKLTIEPKLTVAGSVTIDPTSKTGTSSTSLVIKGGMKIQDRTTPPTITIDIKPEGTATNQKLQVVGDLEVTQNITIGGDLTLTSDFTFPNELTIDGNAEIKGTLTAANAQIAGQNGPFVKTTDITSFENRLNDIENTDIPDLTARVTTLEGGTCGSLAGQLNNHPHSGYAPTNHGIHAQGPRGFTGAIGPRGFTGATGATGAAGASAGCCSSRVYKKNIKPFKDYEKSLQNILNVPLFTYQYKEDHPNKVRMGVISEELPKDLQIKDKGVPSIPDWPTVYGTLWAGIKALAWRLQEFNEKITTQLADLSRSLKEYFTNQIAELKKETVSHIAVLKNHLTEAKTKLQRQSRETDQNTQELSELKKQFQETILSLKKDQEELKKIRKELESARQELKEASSCHSVNKPVQGSPVLIKKETGK